MHSTIIRQHMFRNTLECNKEKTHIFMKNEHYFLENNNRWTEERERVNWQEEAVFVPPPLQSKVVYMWNFNIDDLLNSKRRNAVFELRQTVITAANTWNQENRRREISMVSWFDEKIGTIYRENILLFIIMHLLVRSLEVVCSFPILSKWIDIATDEKLINDSIWVANWKKF